jgi:hypothetical protein
MMQLNVSHCKVVAMPADLLSIARLWTAQAAMNNGLAIECDRERCNEKSYAIYFCPLPTAASCIAYATHEKKKKEKAKREARRRGERSCCLLLVLSSLFFYFEKHHLTVCRVDRSTTRAAPEQINEKSSRKTAERFFSHARLRARKAAKSAG